MNSDYIKIELESKSINEGFARAAVGAFVARLDPSIDELNDIKTAVSEAVTNCIVHAYSDKIGIIHIIVKILENGIVEITVKDKGCGIPDIKLARTPMFTTGGNERSGMGFTVMESFMDSVRVRSKIGHGTTIIMSKRISLRISRHN